MTRGVHNPALAARVVRRTPLLYGAGADPALDRPAHVRAGSGLAQIGPYLALVQDDANFLALVEPISRRVHAVVMPAGPNGTRQFDDRRGNKPLKLDLEACTVVPDAAGDLLLAFGSGSTERREWVLVVAGIQQGTPEVTLHHAAALYAGLRGARAFSGSEMNIEGAVWLSGRVRLFNRGNGAPADNRLPVDATCDLDWKQLWIYLREPDRAAPPVPAAITRHDLGTLAGQRLGFTDACAGPGGMLFFAATAEDSPDTYRDGPVAGSVIGRFAAGRPEWTPLRDASGALFADKVEGLLVGTPSPLRGYAVTDRDDPDAPSELCEIELDGPWYEHPA